LASLASLALLGLLLLGWRRAVIGLVTLLGSHFHSSLQGLLLWSTELLLGLGLGGLGLTESGHGDSVEAGRERRTAEHNTNELTRISLRDWVRGKAGVKVNEMLEYSRTHPTRAPFSHTALARLT
jgi:hypothetical protein